MSEQEVSQLQDKVDQLKAQNKTMRKRLKTMSVDREFQRMFNVKSVSTVSFLVAILAIDTVSAGLGWRPPLEGAEAYLLGGLSLLCVVSFWVIIALRSRRGLSVEANVTQQGANVKANVRAERE